MGLTKSEFFTDEQNALATVAKAFAHPARIAILDYLANVGECVCGDIVNHSPLAQPTVSIHLKELRTAGLVKGTVEGNSICYCIDQNGLDQLHSYFAAIKMKLKSKKKNKCC